MVLNKTNHFNFIRFILALMVLLAHSPELIDGNRSRELLSVLFRQNFSFGEIAVGGFFIVSGFLISKSWHDHPHAAAFIDKRVRRIFPAFIVASLVSAFIVGPIGAQSVSSYFAQFHPLAFAWGVLTLSLPVIPAVFAGQPYPFVNGAMWTIPIEFACYLGVLATGLAGGFKRPVCLSVTILLLGACVLQNTAFRCAWLAPFHPDLAAFFAVGCCYFVFRSDISLTAGKAVVAAVILCVGLLSYRWHHLAFSLAGSYLLFYLAFANMPLLANFGKLPDVSYGLYLYGWPIQKLFIWFYPGISPWTLFALSAVAAIVTGWASWHLVEKRFIRSKRKTSAAAAATAVQVSDTSTAQVAMRD
jgi:peptidoglycan/LPS O-acetylase OafA/YrhL